MRTFPRCSWGGSTRRPTCSCATSSSAGCAESSRAALSIPPFEARPSSRWSVRSRCRPSGSLRTPLGPAPLPNGQTQQFPANPQPMSGRATAIVVDPTNSSKVYLGTAQGGVWRSTDGGTTWTPIFDTAQSLAVGTLALAPSDPTKLYVGTGEPNFSGDTFFGVGVYRIDNVDTSPILVGPMNPQITTGTTVQITTNCFTGRAILKIVVHPTDP